MLGKTEYQTPNAIDLGERPPSRPSRGGSASAAVADVPSVKDVRKNAALLLSATEEIPITSAENKNQSSSSFPYDADDTRDEDYGDDVDGKYSSSLPSVEEARMYAGRILSARSTRDMDPASAERACLTDNQQGTVGGKLSHKYYYGERRKRCYARFLVALLVCILGIVIIALSVRLSEDSNVRGSASGNSGGGKTVVGTSGGTSLHGSPQHSKRMKELISFLDDYSYSPAKALKDPTTAQFQAAAWISDYDLIQYPIPNVASSTIDISEFIERYVMAVFFYSTGGSKDWNDRHKFMSEEHVCAWFTSKNLDDGEFIALGVSCDSDLRVAELLIPKNNLVGSLPTEMGHLEKMHFFDLKDNQLNGIIPDQLERWSNMEFFDVRRNGMKGQIPNWIGEEWKKLKELGLASNFFTGTLPPSMEGLRELRTLSLSDNEIDDTLSKLYGLTQLEYLYLDNNMITGKVDSFTMRDFDDLVQFDISDCELSGALPTEILKHPKLEVLDFSNNDISGNFPVMDTENTILRYFSVASNDLSGTVPGSIDRLVNLHHLDVTGNDLSGNLPLALKKMSKLEYLFASENAFKKGKFPDIFEQMIQLRELSLSASGLTGVIPEWINTMSNLELLDLSWNKMDGAVPESLWKLTGLSYLLLNRNELTGSLPVGVGAANNLKMLLLDKNSINGSLTEYCDTEAGHDLSIIFADCEEVSCTCCQCCSDHEKSCNDDVTYSNLDFGYEHNYTRVAYAFSPEILFGPVTSSQVDKLNTRSGSHS